eukprot:TRINITY_DN26679_c0_g1_i1.p1 TRINITY_DN26679_c0_g1~~TRINITY_DN26679_c0_g1_i1.p1  ORF type:complete len:378 (-),score=60.28 TRINITY_DN26679_c0_g1_i1:81-1190(-)
MSHDGVIMKSMHELEHQLQMQIDFSNNLAARLSLLEARLPEVSADQTAENVLLNVSAESDLLVDTGIELVRTEEELDVARWEVLQSMIKDEHEAHAQLRQTFDTLPLLASQALASVRSDAEESPESSLTASTACLDSAGRGAADAFKTLVKQLREEFNEQLQFVRESVEKAVDAKLGEAISSHRLNLQSDKLEAMSALKLKFQNEKVSIPFTMPQGASVEQGVAQSAREIVNASHAKEGTFHIQRPRSQSTIPLRPRFASSVYAPLSPGPRYPARMTSNESIANLAGTSSALQGFTSGNPGDRATVRITGNTVMPEHGLGAYPHQTWSPSTLIPPAKRATLPPPKLGNHCTGHYWQIQVGGSQKVQQRQ